MGLEIYGRWEAVGFSCFAYNFLPDGTGFYSFFDAQKEFAYKDNADSVTIHFLGDLISSTFKYIIEDDILLI